MATPKKQPKYFDFSQRLRRKATNARCSQKDIAMVLSSNPSVVRKWFDGVSVPTGKKLGGLANMVKTTPEWLLNGDTVELEAVEPTQEPADLEEVTATETPVDSAVHNEGVIDFHANTAESKDEEVTATEAPVDSTTNTLAEEETTSGELPETEDTKQADGVEEVTPMTVSTTAKPVVKKRVTREVKPKLTLKENIERLEAELKVLRKQAKLEKRAEHEALGSVAFNLADKDAAFAKTLLESLQASLESRPKQANAKALKEIMLAVEKKVLVDEDNAGE